MVRNSLNSITFLSFTLGLALAGCASKARPQVVLTPLVAKTTPTGTPAKSKPAGATDPRPSADSGTLLTPRQVAIALVASAPPAQATQAQAQAQAPAPIVASSAPLSVRVLTFNLGLLKISNPAAAPDPTAKPGQGDIVPLVDERAEAAPLLLAAYATQNNVDVIGLQEVWRKADLERISTALLNAGYTIFLPNYRPPEASVLKGFFDLLSLAKSDDLSGDISKLANLPLPKVNILSSGLLLAVGPRIKIRNPEFKGFREKGGFETFSDKGFIVADLEQIGAKQPNSFTAVLAHFQAMSTANGGVPYIPSEFNAFQAQQEQVKAVIDRKTAKGGSAILFGDMNVGPAYAEKQFNRFSSEFKFRNAFFEANPQAVVQKMVTWNQNNPLIKAGERSEEHSSIIDHVFLTGSGWRVDQGKIAFSEELVSTPRPEFSKKVPLSDHYAVDVSLRLEPSAQ